MRHLFLGTAVAICMGGASWAQPASYATPQDAFDAFLTAVENSDQSAFEAVVGGDGVDLVLSDDQVENRINRAVFLELVREGYRFRPTDDGVELILGGEDWPFPIPLAKGDDGWKFDIEAGREEVLAREIGLNELTVIDLMLAYVELQAEFRRTDHDQDGVMEFARSIISDADARDGLFWPGSEGLVGAALARAEMDGWSDGETDFEPEPFMGYYFSILHGQGENAAGGAYSYEVNGNLVSGHALIAVPAEYGESGVHSFLIGENGQLFEADFGEETLEVATDISVYEPGAGWSLVTDIEGVN
jgi:hypothetical protein